MLSSERNDQIRLIRESVAGLVPKRDFRRVRALRFDGVGFDRAVWRAMCELGWSGLRVAEDRGGLGLGVVEFCTIAEELGAGLVPEPFVAAAVAPLLDDAALAPVLAGERVVLPALHEAPNRLEPGRSTHLRDGKVTGAKLFVTGAAGADLFLLSTDAGLALVERDAPGVSIVPRSSQDGGNLCTVRFRNAPARALPGDVAGACEEMTLATAFYLLGAMETAFDLTLDYVKTRRQFGQTIGSFQAVRHKLADLKIALEVTRATLNQSALALERETEEARRRIAVSRAKARAADAAMAIASAAVQFHGGMGYTDENDIGLCVRRILSLYNLFGSARLHRRRFAELGGLALTSPEADAAAAPAVDLDRLPDDLNQLDDADFRLCVRRWIEDNYPAELPRFPTFRPRRAATKTWYDRLTARGWLAPGWPREHGGMELSTAKRVIMIEEMDRFGCARFSDQGVVMVGPLLMNYGTPEQRARFLPRILSGEHIWAQGYSEPGAGSDLAGLRTEAVRDGDEWVVSGQKTWTTLANDANWFYVLARTDKTVKKQEGISVFLVPADAPGVSVRPFKTLAMHEEFCDVFFDDVRVPADALVGPLNGGWGIAKALLGFERVFLGSLAQSSKAYARLSVLAHSLGLVHDAGFRDELAGLAADIADHAALYELYLDKVRRREELGPDVSMLKINQTELYRRITRAMVDIAGEHAGIVGEIDELGGVGPADVWVQSLPATIYGGASEVQRDIVAKQVLGL